MTFARKLGLISLLWSVSAFSFSAFATYKVTRRVSTGKATLLSVEKTSDVLLERTRTLKQFPFFLAEDSRPSQDVLEEVLYRDDALPPEETAFYGRARVPFSQGQEVRTLVESGPAQNRIVLTILGDGYTEDERQKFFDDAERITKDLFEVSTFQSYLPLFNVKAVFVPSKDSGITDLKKRNTAFGLYRDPKGSKRAILPGDILAIERALSAAGKTDYPIIIANDEFYGGLGGRYAITTRSLESGSMVLRHELGHNFGVVGEEYDGGTVYRGANFSDSSNVPWKVWASEAIKVHNAKFLSGHYVWKNLSDGEFEATFDFPSPNQSGPYCAKFELSAVGNKTPGDIELTVDSKEESVEGLFTIDRSFFQSEQCKILAPGRHRMRVRETNKENEDVLAFARATAFAADYDFTPDVIAAFPNFNDNGRLVGYRPTHEQCLMRNMRSIHFCAVDKENMWHEFFKRISLIDAVTLSNEQARVVKLSTPPLTGLSIRWYKVPSRGAREELTQFRDKTSWTVPSELSGSFEATVDFKTNEVRDYRNKGRFSSTQRFSL